MGEDVVGNSVIGLAADLTLGLLDGVDVVGDLLRLPLGLSDGVDDVGNLVIRLAVGLAFHARASFNFYSAQNFKFAK